MILLETEILIFDFQEIDITPPRLTNKLNILLTDVGLIVLKEPDFQISFLPSLYRV